MLKNIRVYFFNREDERSSIIRILLSALLILFVVFIAYLYTQRLRTNNQKDLNRLLLVNDNLTELLSSLQDAEIGQRGYLLTGKNTYLTPYRRAQTATPENLRKVDSLLSENSVSNKAVQHLSGLIERKFAELDQTIRLHQSGQEAEAYLLVNSDLGKNIMDSIRFEIMQFSTTREVRFNVAAAYASKLETLVGVMIAGSILAFCFLLYTIYSRIDPILAKTVKYRKELERKNEQLEHFAYITSHDLNEPLRTISGFIDLLKDDLGEEVTEDTKTCFDFITGAAARLREMIDGILTYSKIGRSGYLTEIDLSEEVSILLEDISGVIQEKQAEVVFSGLPVVKCRRTEVKQLFQNLILNAIKFSREGVLPRVIIKAEDLKTHWKFSVADNGIGIPANKREEVFQIFTKLHRSSVYAGHGIGLSFCRKIVELHEGEIWLESKVDEGTTFFFTLSKKLKNEDEAD